MIILKKIYGGVILLIGLWFLFRNLSLNFMAKSSIVTVPQFLLTSPYIALFSILGILAGILLMVQKSK